MPKRVLYLRQDGRWAWRLDADNGAVIATDGGPGYEKQNDARAMADRILRGEFKHAAKMMVTPTES